MSDKTKRRLVITGAAVLCIALVAAIGMRFAKEPVKPDSFSQEVVSSSEVAPDMQNNTEEKEMVVSPQPTTSEPESTKNLPPQTDLSEQQLQPDPVKPEVPENPVLPEDADTTDPSKTPEYEAEDTEKKPTSGSESQSSGGLPGFDNVQDVGANQGEYLDDMYENGNKIGIMD